MPKVLFVIPPCFSSRGLDFEIGFPVHLPLLGRVARQESWDVSYLDMTLEEKDGNDSFTNLALALRSADMKLVGISNHTVRTSITTRKVAEYVKAVRPEVQVVVGGVNSTFMWRELLESCPAIDYILRGYAQPGLRELLVNLRDGSSFSIPGLAKRENGEFSTEELVAPSSEDFAVSSLEGLEVDRYLEWTRTYPLLTHTGCGFACNFCTSVMPGPYQNKEVYRPPSDVVAEMNRALALGFERFFISDNVFTSRRDRCLEICSAFSAAEIPARSNWVCMTRVEFVDENLLTAMRAAGCTNIAYGVESAGASQWKSLRKGRFSEETICKAFELTRRVGISTSAYLMLGAPSQTPEDIEATIDLVRRLDPDYRVVSFFQPFPGTPYWNEPEKFGLSEIAPLDQWNFHEAPICQTKHLSKQQLTQAAIRLYLERGMTVDPKKDTLVTVGDLPEEYGHIPTVVQKAFGWIDEKISIDGILERAYKEHSFPGRLIVLYWFSAALKDRIVAIKPVEDLEKQYVKV